MGNIRVVILVHKKDDVFLWPAVWQQPKNFGSTGILGKSVTNQSFIHYELALNLYL